MVGVVGLDGVVWVDGVVEVDGVVWVDGGGRGGWGGLVTSTW